MSMASDSSHKHQAESLAQLPRMMLELFSPRPSHDNAPLEIAGKEKQALWAADALHRANNLAAMAAAFDSTRWRTLYGMAADDRAVQARALSRAYAELGAPGDARSITCAPLLEVIALRLIALFGDERLIRLHVSADHVALPVEQRRALTLIASELVINVLKYAFAESAPGVISIILTQWSGGVELIVADNGRGLPANQAVGGMGTILMQQLAALLNADVRRCSTENGLSVVVSMPWPAASDSGRT